MDGFSHHCERNEIEGFSQCRYDFLYVLIYNPIMNQSWKEKLKQLLAKGQEHFVGTEPRGHSYSDFYYWQGYIETINELTEGDSSTLTRLIADNERRQNFQRPRMSPTASPRLYLDGCSLALKDAQKVLEEIE